MYIDTTAIGISLGMVVCSDFVAKGKTRPFQSTMADQNMCDVRKKIGKSFSNREELLDGSECVSYFSKKFLKKKHEEYF